MSFWTKFRDAAVQIGTQALPWGQTAKTLYDTVANKKVKSVDDAYGLYKTVDPIVEKYVAAKAGEDYKRMYPNGRTPEEAAAKINREAESIKARIDQKSENRRTAESNRGIKDSPVKGKARRGRSNANI